jgi:hypothetical protein
MPFGNVQRRRASHNHLRIDPRGWSPQHHLPQAPRRRYPQQPGTFPAVQRPHGDNPRPAADTLSSPIQQTLGRRNAACSSTLPALGETATPPGWGQDKSRNETTGFR